MDKVAISVIIPVYNAEEYLDRCLNSILSQDFSSYEVVLVDDGSTDSSPLICDRYSSTDARFRTIHKMNGGVSSARNAGINVAKGEYLMFVDSDDSLPDGAMKTLYASASGRADFVLGGFDVIADDVRYLTRIPSGIFFEEDALASFFDRNVVRNGVYLNSPWAKLFARRIIVNERLLFDESLSYGEDMIFVNTFLLYACRIAVAREPVYNYYVRSGSLGSDILSERHISQLMILLPRYAELIRLYQIRCPDSAALAGLYHNDLIGRFVFRILRIFTIRRSEMLTEETLRSLYGFMDADKGLSVFNVRVGQSVNVLLYKIGSVRLSVAYYRFTSWVFTHILPVRK